VKPEIVLAYSGGLDTSFLIPYLKKARGAEIACVTVNTGGMSPEREREITDRAKALGARDVRIVDAREAYYADVLAYLIKGNVLRGGVYPLCVGAERIVQARELVKIARERKASAIAHGSTAAGNDQVRFEVYFRVLAPEIEILAPVRDEGIVREKEVAFLREMGVDVPASKARYSVNEGLWGKTIGSRELQDPSAPVPDEAFGAGPLRSDAERIRIGFENGLPVSIDGKRKRGVALVEELAELGTAFGIGRGVHLGNTILGIKGRIAFEAPAAAILLEAHRELEKLVLTKWETFWKGQLSAFYGDLLHEGQYLDPVMREIEAFLDRSQERVTGTVDLRLAPYRVWVDGVGSPHSLVATGEATYGEEARSWTGAEARGFARISATASMLWNRAGGKP
jgi:argininosuccinate synthase